LRKSPPNEITIDLNLEHIVLHSKPADSAIPSNLPTLGSRRKLPAAPARAGLGIANDQVKVKGSPITKMHMAKKCSAKRSCRFPFWLGQ
jgi:hypothetical protein